MYKLCVLFMLSLLAGCYSDTNLAPVVELKWQPKNGYQARHVVRRGETLYAIAFRHDIDYRQLAAINGLNRPYALRVGQVLSLRSGHRISTPRQFTATPRIKAHYPPPKKVIQYNSRLKPRIPAAAMNRGKWLWPVKGRVAAHFAPLQGKKGIDIAGKKGEMIQAASSGVVAYSGSGLLGYGNLIIIKHNAQMLTAYGNNSRNLVKEGQKVKVGQNIAEIGLIDRRYWGVHFEIRKDGRPVNPLDYLR